MRDGVLILKKMIERIGRLRFWEETLCRMRRGKTVKNELDSLDSMGRPISP